MSNLPRSPELVKPLLFSLRSGEVLSNLEIRERVASELNLSEVQLSQIHSGSRTEFEYRLAWARTFAKSKGWIDSPKRMCWRITDSGMKRI
jgi:restriction system protein